MKNIHTQESGRSMIEMLGVLAIIGVLSVGGIAGYSQAMSKFKVTKTTDQIQTMVQNIRTLYASQKNYTGLSTNSGADFLYQVGILTDENCPAGAGSCSAPKNPYDGTIVINPIGTNNKHFYVSYQGLTNDACVRLASQAWGDSSSGLTGVRAASGTSNVSSEPSTTAGTNGNATVATNTTDGASGLMTLASASAGCGTNNTSSSVLTLYFK